MNKFYSEFNTENKFDLRFKMISELQSTNTNKEAVQQEDIITNIQPIYHRSDQIPNFTSVFPKSWDLYQFIDASDPKEANLRCLEALNNGVNGLFLSNPSNLNVLLGDINIENIRIDFQNYQKGFIKKWEQYSKNKNVKGAFHNLEGSNLLDTIFAKGTTIKKQIIYAFNKGLEHKTHLQFHFEIGSNYFLEIAKLESGLILKPKQLH